jgi:hypothetical protein
MGRAIQRRQSLLARARGPEINNGRQVFGRAAGLYYAALELVADLDAALSSAGWNTKTAVTGGYLYTIESPQEL